MTRLGTETTFIIGSKPDRPTDVADVAFIVASDGIQGFTSWPVQGYWQGSPEPAVAVLVAGLSAPAADTLAETLRAEFDQDAVYVSRNGQAYLIERPS